MKIIKNFPKDNIEINDKFNFLFNGYSLTFELKQWRSENINNYLFSCDEGKNLIQEISHFQLLFMIYMRKI